MGNQRPDTNDRVIDVLGELVAQLGSNLVVALADMAVGSGEALQIRDRFNIPNDYVAHMGTLSLTANRDQSERPSHNFQA